MTSHDRGRDRPESFEVRIDRLIYGGWGLGRRSGKVVFVPFSLPGDRLLVRTVEEKKTFTRARIVEILEPGAGRVAPPCPYFGSCGGCQLQHLEYARQVEAKREILEGIFHHRFPETRELPIGMKASGRDYGYRSRARFQIRGYGSNARVGYFRFHSHEVEDIHSCPLLRPALDSGLASIRKSCREASGPGPPQVEAACVEETNRWEAVPLAPDSDEAADLYRTAGGWDPPLLERKVGVYRYAVSPAAFFQANDFMLGELVETVISRAGAGRSALDLFCGVGLFTLPLAGRFESVDGVDSSCFACELARRNSANAGLGNVRISCVSADDWTEGSEASPGDYDLIVLDPPRVGAGPEVMDRIRRLAPETAVYVSCDPQTLARDIALLTPRYRIDFIQGLDLFPQTFHFETVVRLKR